MAVIPSIEIGYDEAVEILNELIEGKEDFVYKPQVQGSSACVYVWDGQPSCLIGQLLARKGADNEFLHECDQRGPVAALVATGLLVCDERTMRLLADVQSDQDRGTRWDFAVQRAILATIEGAK